MALVCLEDMEKYARQHLNREVWLYYSQGAEREETLRENTRAFTRYRLIPRMLRNVPSRDMSVTVLGEKLPLPIGIAPTAYQRFAHPEGEIAAAAAAAEMGVIYTLSTLATASLGDVAKAVNGRSPLWMQVYVLEERKDTELMIREAEANGYKALVLTVDTPVTGLRRGARIDPTKLPSHLTPCNVMDAVRSSSKFDGTEQSYIRSFTQTLTWNDVVWMKSISSLPLILKGIITAEDAVRVASLGAAAVWVSNHGGRQLDGVDATIDVLPEISAALEGTGCEVYMDGGVRWGSDIMKALALGAKAVFIGRPALWGLAHSGKNGVRKVVQILKDELDTAMHLAGCKDIQDIGSHLIRKDIYSRI